MIPVSRLLLIAATAVSAAACEDDTVCAGVGIDGIVVEVRQPSGESALAGSMIVARDGVFADTAGPVVPYPGSRAQFAQNVALAMNRGGDYSVTVTKPHWTSTTQRVRVPGGACGYVETKNVSMQISPLPGAPPVRSVAVDPRSVRFDFCGGAIGPETYVDADPGLAGGVVWRTENPLVATVTPAGLVTARSRGTTAVRALAVADTTISGRMTVQVDPICPQ